MDKYNKAFAAFVILDVVLLTAAVTQPRAPSPSQGAALNIVPTPTVRPTPTASATAPSTPTPKPSPTPAYPTEWVATACGALGSLGEAVGYRDDLITAIGASDYYAIGKTGGYIALSAYDALTDAEDLPAWTPGAPYARLMQGAAGTMVDAGSFLKEGGENVSSTTVERGVINFGVAVDTAADAADEFKALSTRYDFDCR